MSEHGKTRRRSADLRNGAAGPVTVEKILEASSRLFAERGYYNTSMEDIASAVGILKGSLYHHVSSKEQILDRILEEMAMDLVTKTQEAMARDQSTDARFDETVRIMVQNVEDNRDANAIYTTEHKRLPTSMRKKYRSMLAGHRKMFERVVQELLSERDRDAVADVDVPLAVTSIISLASMMSLWYRPEGRLSVDEIEDQFVRQARRILGILS